MNQLEFPRLLHIVRGAATTWVQDKNTTGRDQIVSMCDHVLSDVDASAGHKADAARLKVMVTK